ncbi:unnamed protein product [Clavelina lepadiformis]|uniref:Peptidase S72 domain-containing protein n=1 Tax=Clavelina lepadiformis TaxID=159417 RepID=A0ABP0GB26_CLALP
MGYQEVYQTTSKGIHTARRHENDLNEHNCPLNNGRSIKETRNADFRQFHKRATLKYATLSLCFLFLLLDSVTGQRHIGLQPSRTMFPALSREEDFNPGMEDPTPRFLEKPCIFSASVGTLFNQSMMNEIGKMNTSISMDASLIEVQISNPELSDWIIYDKTRALLQGVPLKNHVGLRYQVLVSALTVNSKEPINFSCLVVVEADKKPIFAADKRLRWRPGTDAIGCLPNEPVVHLVLWLDATKDDLSPKKRVSLLENLIETFSTVKTFTPELAAIEIRSTNTHRGFLSGNGNSKKESDDLPDVALSWPLGCGTDSVAPTDLDQVESASQNGSLALAVGHDIIMWSAENRKPKQTRGRDIKRYKRQIKPSQFASPVPPNLLATPGSGSLSNSDVEPFDESQSRSSRRSSHHRIMIPESPGIKPPPSTPAIKVPDRPAPPVPSSPGISRDNLRLSINEPTGHHPQKDAGVDDIHATAATYFEYRIPRNAFRDEEDGNTRSLSLSLSKFGTPFTGSKWLMLDSPSQTLFGVPPRSYKSIPGAQSAFVLTANDTSGRTVTDNFAVHYSQRPRPANHRITISFTYNKKQPTLTVTSLFLRRLSSALGAGMSDIRPPGHFTVQKTDFRSNFQQLTWFDNTANSKKRCDRGRIENWWRIITGLGVDYGKLSAKPTSAFIRNFSPDFLLRSAKISLFGPCSEPKTKATLPPPPPPPLKTKPIVKKPITETATTTSKFPPVIDLLPDPTPITIKKLDPSNTPDKQASINQPTKTFSDKNDQLLPRYSAPYLTDPEHVIVLSARVGRISKAAISRGLFVTNNPNTYGEDLTLQLLPWGDGEADWVTLDTKDWYLIALPQAPDVQPLHQLNSTHREWKGGVRALDQWQRSSQRVRARIILPDWSPNDDTLDAGVTHLFKMTILNYALHNFTTLDSDRLMRTIRDIYGDSDLNNLYIYPPESGSVIFSWLNLTLASEDHCPYKGIADMADVIFEKVGSKYHVKSEVMQKLKDAGFDVENIALKNKNACTKYPKTISSSTPAPKTTAAVVPVDSAPTSSGGTTSIIIIAVVLSCVVFLVVIAVVKCRSSVRRKRKDKEQKNKAADSLIAPGGSYHFGEYKKSGDVSPEQKFRYKPGTPIVFDGETENGHLAAPLLRSQQTSFITRPSPSSSCGEPGNDKTLLTDTSPSDGNDVRPPPPPYIRK